MKKNYTIFLCSLLTLVCISAYQYSVFLDNFLQEKLDQMLKMAQISGINMAGDFDAFENELSIINREQFINQILSDRINTETIRRLKQFFFRNEALIKKISFFNNGRMVSVRKTPDNHFHFEDVNSNSLDLRASDTTNNKSSRTRNNGEFSYQ